MQRCLHFPIQFANKKKLHLISPQRINSHFTTKKINKFCAVELHGPKKSNGHKKLHRPRFIFPTVALNGPNKFFSTPPTSQRSVLLHFPLERRVPDPQQTKKFTRGMDRTASPSRGYSIRFLRCIPSTRHAFSSSSLSSMRWRWSHEHPQNYSWLQAYYWWRIKITVPRL